MTEINDSGQRKDSKTDGTTLRDVWREFVIAIGIIADISVDLVVVPIQALSQPVIAYLTGIYRSYKVQKALKSYDMPKNKEDVIRRTTTGKYTVKGIINSSEKSDD